ncbi:MAG TPA: hypothetical protein VH352_05665, partial [Pseudonocardiaceae bacterium]|nr:hypothetical protein [Pseudonocardiaceae bacterium]
ADVASRFVNSGMNISRAQMNALPPALRTAFLNGFAHALHGVFLSGVVVAAVGFALALLLREVPLRKREQPTRTTDHEQPASN